MISLSEALLLIAAARKDEPLAPVTVVVPSHIAGLQLRRRLTQFGPFAGVRFETLPRIAEVLGAARLASSGRSPLARPIADYVAQEVARQSQGEFARVGELAGYGRALRQIFRRLRRGGVMRLEQVPEAAADTKLREIFRLYALFQDQTSQFYDEEDLLNAAAAAVSEGKAGALADLGSIFVVPPGAESAGAANLLEALRGAAPAYTLVDESPADPETRFVLAPDPATEGREVAREVTAALGEGIGLHEIAVFHGADSSYPRLLREALSRADIPAAPMPGVPLVETPAGRAVLALASLPEEDFARAAVLDFLSVAPIRSQLPTADSPVPALVAAWERMSRTAGITHGVERWRLGLATLIEDREADLATADGNVDEARQDARRAEIGRARDLAGFVQHLVQRLDALSPRQSAPSFIAAFKEVVHAYLRPDAQSLDKVEAEIDQLGTVGAIGGEFGLRSFTRALRANMEAAVQRERSFGDGVLIADYRLAAGLEFRRVIICGAYDGAFPVGAGSDMLVEDRFWQQLHARFPYIEDASVRLTRAQAAASRASAAAGDGGLVWSAPLNQASAGGEYYPAPQMVAAARKHDEALKTASALRGATGTGWLRRPRSPMSSLLAGIPIEASDVSVREAVLQKRSALPVEAGHPLHSALLMLRARRGSGFTEWDGNLAGVDDPGWLALTATVSPTSLENYATCGFRYLGRSLLRINVVEEIEERETMDPAERGTLIHDVLDKFFREKQAEGRPRVNEAWTAADAQRLLAILDGSLGEARARGRTGLDLYASYEARNIRADLVAFLERDTDFRRATGAVPTKFEVSVPEVEIAGVRLRGYADRIDETPDKRAAWVIDYKSGSVRPFEGLKNPADPLLGGTKLQLPVYLTAAPAGSSQTGVYWFITRRADFVQYEYHPTPENQERFSQTLRAIVDGIASGAFPAVSGEEDERYGGFANCSYCDFNRLCSRRRDNEISAKLGDGRLAPWLAVGQKARGEQQP
jgi:ATP-dependent helicase/nuclease subunit B